MLFKPDSCDLANKTPKSSPAEVKYILLESPIEIFEL